MLKWLLSFFKSKPLNFISNARIEVKSFTSSEIYTVNIEEMTCTCPDFTSRRCWAQPHSTNRLCKHIAFVLSEKKELIPQELLLSKQQIFFCAENKKGLPYNADIFHSQIFLNKKLEFSPDKNKEAVIKVKYGTEEYKYNLEEEKWSSKKPIHDDILVQLVKRSLGLESDNNLDNSIIELEKELKEEKHKKEKKQPAKTGYDLLDEKLKGVDPSEVDYIIHSNDTVYSASINGEIYDFNQNMGKESFSPTWEADIKPLLEDALGEALADTIGYTERSTYFVVYRDNPKNWLCRVHFGKNDLKSVELKNEQKLALKSNGKLYKNDHKILKDFWGE